MLETFNFLIESNMKELMDYSKSLSNEPDDLFQDTIERIIIKKDLYRENIPFIAWAKKIMKNLWLNKLKYEKIRSSDNLDDHFDIKSEADSVSISKIKEKINKLLNNNNLLIEPFWKYFEGYNYKEISESLGIPEGTVKSRIFNARKIMKEKIKGEE